MSRSRGLGIASVCLFASVAFVVAGCGSSDNGGSTSSSGGGGTIIRGTIDQPVSYDPAGAYDLPSYDVIYNVYQNLVTVPPGGNKAVPEAADSCDFTDPKTYECTMKSGLKFSDGSTLDAKDVVFSFKRNVVIADPNGASSLLTNVSKKVGKTMEAQVEAPDAKTVVFHLNAPDATFPLALTTGSFAIVPADGPNAYPADKLESDQKIVGSGRYTVASYKPGQQTVLERNDAYTGEDPALNDRVFVVYYDKSSALKLAVEQGEVDIAYRSLSPTDIADLKGKSGVSVVQGNGIEIRYLNFNFDLMPGDSDAQKLAIRQAVAQTVDRQAIADRVYNGTVKPLYSMVPQGLQYATEPFKDKYGEAPDVGAAKKTLSDAGVKTPVPLEIWWTPTHYGPASGDEYAEIKRQLDDSGLFDVTLKDTEWTQYSTAAFTDKYPEYQLGWFPDYPDGDDYTASFLSKDSFLNLHYNNPEMEKLLAEEKASTNEGERAKAFTRIQEISAEDVPNIPIWQGGQVAAVRDGVNGVEDTFDPAYIFRYWLVSKD
jgi:peptide/nickel transport system substrate-binding protein